MDSRLHQAHAAVKRDDYASAWVLSNQVLNENPDSPEALFLMGTTLRGLGNIGLAVNCLAKALAYEKKQPNLWMAYAATLHDLNKWEDAIDAFSVVNAMLPDDDMPIANIAASFNQMGRWHDSLTWADRALAINPTNYIAKISKTFASLALGRWKDGWANAEYLYGYHLPERIYSPVEKEEPQWDGSPGKTVVVQCDQGIGDQIMFSQCIPEMQKDCKKVILECAERMVPLFKRNFPGVDVYGTGKDEKVWWAKNYEIDAHVHISYLGKWYRKTDKDFPRQSYLTPDPELVEKWKKWLHEYPAPYTGISWKGGIQATQTHIRSMTLPELGPIIPKTGTPIDLSYMDNGREISLWNLENEKQIVRPPIDVNNYDDTVALVAALDEVVTVTTTLVHVCGALGRTAKVLVPTVAQWRYAYKHEGGETMIWYPKDSVRLFRQEPGEQDWTFAVNRLARTL